MAFTEKVKIINSYIPEKSKLFIENNLLDELKYFQKKYLFKVNIFSDTKFVIPEYKIDLLNKSKKIIKSFENIHLIPEVKKINSKKIKEKKEIFKEVSKSKNKVKKSKSKVKIRTLWVRKKKKKLN